MLLFVGATTRLLAADFYVDPIYGSAGGDGSAGDPWRTLEEVWESGLIETRHWSTLPYVNGATLKTINAGAPVKAGDRLILRDGFHGEFWVRGAYNADTITIVAQDGHVPRLNRVLLSAAANWTLRGLSISPSHAPIYSSGTMVEIENHGYHGPSWSVVIEDCDIFSVDDASGWSGSDWVDLAASAINVEGERVSVLRNHLRNVRHGITVSGDHAEIRRNTIDGFSADGLRGLGDYGLFEYNEVKNAFAGSAHGDGNHDDGFQSWSFGPGGVGTGEVRGVVLRGNKFVNAEDPDHPLVSTLQGIGCFDGFFVDWVVENNVVITDHWHGISFYGMRDSRVVNNTVVDLNATAPGPAWLLVRADKDDVPSENTVVRNNLAATISVSGINMSNDSNVEFANPAQYFVDPPLDVHLLEAGPGVNNGSAIEPPALDAERIARPQGPGIDLGAYEWHLPGVQPEPDIDDPCSGAWDVTLTEPDTGTTITHESCNWIRAGGSYVVGGPQQITLGARRSVGLRDGFRVEAGGLFIASLGPTILNP